jgi:hypothetical protein
LLGNPKRFNVAISRAKALMVVVGNPFVLADDVCWRHFLQYCVAHQGYVGVPLSLDKYPPSPYWSARAPAAADPTAATGGDHDPVTAALAALSASLHSARGDDDFDVPDTSSALLLGDEIQWRQWD